MLYDNPDAEQALENATLALFAELGWETVNSGPGRRGYSGQ